MIITGSYWIFLIQIFLLFLNYSYLSSSHPHKHTLKIMTTFYFYYLKKNFFWCGPFLKSLLNLLQYCFCFMFWIFGCEACGILAPRPGIKLAPPALEGEGLTTGPPGKSLYYFLFNCNFFIGKHVYNLEWIWGKLCHKQIFFKWLKQSLKSKKQKKKVFLAQDQPYKKTVYEYWIKHPFLNSATFKCILLTVDSSRRVTTPHFTKSMLTVPKENYLKKKKKA